MRTAIERYTALAAEPRFSGWPIVGTPTQGVPIPFFGTTLTYQLHTGNGIEEYTSILRSFGWAVVFGVTYTPKRIPEVITLVQWKPGVNQASWELPPGGIGKVAPGTSMEEITKRTQASYLTETGYGGGAWTYLGNLLIETGKYRGAGTDDHGLPAHLYLATNVTKVQDARAPNPNEIMETLLVPLAEWQEVLTSNLFREASAVSCAYAALLELGRIGFIKKHSW
jgi:hypothetical protein